MDSLEFDITDEDNTVNHNFQNLYRQPREMNYNHNRWCLHLLRNKNMERQ